MRLHSQKLPLLIGFSVRMLKQRPQRMLMAGLLCFASFAGFGLATGSAHADETWSGLANNTTWNNAGNWSPVGVPNAQGTVVDFGPTTVLSTRLTLSLGSVPETIGGITFNSTQAYSITGTGSGALTLNVSSGNDTILMGNTGSLAISANLTLINQFNVQTTASNTSTLTISGIVTSNNNSIFYNGTGTGTFNLSSAFSGAGSISQDGSGTLILSGANTYSGGTFIGFGTLDINNSAALGATASTFTIFGGTLDNTSAGAITLTNNNGINVDGDFTFTGTQNLNLGTGDVFLLNSTAITVNAGTLTLGGMLTEDILDDGFGVTKAGAGTLVLSGSNIYDGVTIINAGTLVLSGLNNTTGGTILNGGTLDLDSNTALGASSSNLTIVSGTLDNTTGGAFTIFNNNPITVSGSFTFTGTQSLNLGTGAVTLSASPTITVSANTLTLGGVISGSQSLTKAGAGTLVLSAANTFTGGTTLSAGTLIIGSSTSIGTGTFTINGGTLDNLSGGALTLTNNNTVSIGNSFTYTGSNSLNLGTGATALASVLSPDITITVNANSLTIGGVISGANDIIKAGAGTLVLNGANTFTGGLKLNAGTVDLNNNFALGTGTFTINGGTFDNTSGEDIFLFNNNNIILNANLTFTGTNGIYLGTSNVALNVSPTIFVGANTLTVDGIISGAFNLTKTGAGTLLLGGQNSYSGNTTINAGYVTEDYSQNSAPTTNIIAGGILTLAGGTLELNGHSFATNSQSFSSTTFNAGNSSIVLNQNSASSLSLILNAITRNSGGTVDFTLPTTSNISTTTTTKLTGNILTTGTNSGTAYATVNGTDWATVVSGSIVATTSYTGTNTVSTWSGNNVSLTGNPSSNVVTVSIKSLKFNGDSLVLINAANTLTITTGGILVTGTGIDSISGGTVKGSSSGELVVIQNDTTRPFTIDSAIANNIGATALTKSGPGDLILEGANTYNGTTFLNAGTILLSSGNSLGNTTVGSFIINGGGIDDAFNIALTLVSKPIVVNSSFVFVGDGPINLGAGAVTLNTSPTVTVSASTLTIGGIISGAQSLTKDGAGTLVLTGVNTFTGGVTVLDGKLNISADTGLGAVPSSVTLGNVLLNGGVLQAAASLTISGNRGIALGPTSGTGTGFIDTQAFTVTYAGIIADNGDGTGNLTKFGSGTLELDGANTFSGNLNMTGGTLTLGNSLAAQNAILNYTAGTLNLPVTHATIGGLAGTQNIALASGYALALDPGANSFAVYSGILSGTSAFVSLNGSGFQVFSGANTYTGGTLLNSGELIVENTSALGTGTITINGGTLDNVGGSITLSTNNTQSWNGNFTFAGTNSLNLGTGAVTLGASPTVTVSANVLTVGGAIGDSHNGYSLTKAGAGTLVLAGANTYTGSTTVAAGTLQVSGSLSGGQVEVNSGANLSGTGTLNTLVILDSGSFLSPGSGGAGRLTMSDLTWNGAFTATPMLKLTLSTTDNTSTQVSTNVLFKGTAGNYIFDFGNTGYFANGLTPTVYTLLNFNANVGFLVSDFSYTHLGQPGMGTFILNSNSLQFSVVVPEPSAWPLLAGGVVLGTALVRRRRQ